MNVKLSSGIKVIFNENEGALRVILTENADPSQSQSPEDSEEQEQEVVIYAMKVRAVAVLFQVVSSRFSSFVRLSGH
jgi:hypothetical protein